MNFHVLLIKTHYAYLKFMRPFMQKTGMSEGQPKVLRYVKEHPDCTQKELAEYYSIEAATVSRILNGMEEQGLLKRRTPDKDRRVICLNLTDKGREAFAQFEIYRGQVEKKAFQGFTKEEKSRFCESLERILDNLGEQQNGGVSDNGSSIGTRTSTI